jgi:hypothetical protein
MKLSWPRPRHRKHRSRSLRVLDPNFNPTALIITSVHTSTPAEQVKIFFAGNITWDGSTVPSAFRADTSDGPLDGCINVIATGSNWIEVEFNGSVSVGADWRVEGPMSGITAAGGGAVAWPQSGNVTA